MPWGKLTALNPVRMVDVGLNTGIGRRYTQLAGLRRISGDATEKQPKLEHTKNPGRADKEDQV
jgi:hypothetical protein